MRGSDPNEEGLRAIGRAIDESRRPGGRGRRAPTHEGSGAPRARRARPRRHRWLKRTLLIGAVVIVLAVGAGVGYGFYLNHEVHRVTVKGLTSGATTGGDANTQNILMVGSTTRCGLTHQTPAYGLCTQGVTGVNSDVVMILHLDPSAHSVSILSLPRTLFIPNARSTSTGAYKIDAALAQGPSQLVAAIEEDFAIPIQHYVELNFDTFASIVTSLGGITMEFPVPVFDRFSGLRVFTTGCHHLDGVQALQVVRARHLQYWVPGDTPNTPSTWPQEAQSDLARIRRDHEFLRVLASKEAKRGLGNPVSDLSLINTVAPQLTVDSSLSPTAMVSLVLTFHSVDINKAPQYTLPVRVDTFGTYLYKGRHQGTIEFPTEPTDQSLVDKFLGLGPGTNTMTGEPLPSPGSVSVSVVNGTGTYDQATQTATALGRLGFHMVGTGTTTPPAQQSETLVTYSQRTPAVEAAAQLVADSISGAVILDHGPTTDGAQVTVTTGTDFAVDQTLPGHAAATPPSSTAGGSAATGATASSSTASTASVASPPQTTSFTSPSPAVEPLRPWDPRACPAGAVGNSGNW